MATYLAAIQNSRALATKLHALSFGITTDSSIFQFWFLDSDRHLVSSKPFDWRFDKNLIIAWIDKMLADAIEASPLTTPVLRRNISLRNWENNFKQRHHLNPESDSSPTGTGVPLDIYFPESGRVVGQAFYHGRTVLVIEYDENEEN
jgi:hypothetical protein